MTEILLVEDNPTIVKGLEYAFQKKEYGFQAAGTVREAKQLLRDRSFSLVVLDISLPDGNGLRFYEEEVRKRNLPTLFLTAEDDEEIIVQGFHLGAEDYVTKPFSTKELMARIQRILLRYQKSSQIRLGEVTFDLDKMIVERDGTEVGLTSLERKLFHLLVLNRNKVVTRNTILDKIWEWTGNDVDDHTVTVYMRRIRQKVGSDVITTVKGIGYRVDQDEK